VGVRLGGGRKDGHSKEMAGEEGLCPLATLSPLVRY
jgi:hypothetical protein